ncbi:extracellular solute-binding protein [Devosia sp.]|uniref:extracellular solute-binding protein n=1 Tax=Devosia sp. TaxID=1871048 RepID=UPI002627C73E|nr:extracellular solute-binding protein [Devosia sp.]
MAVISTAAILLASSAMAAELNFSVMESGTYDKAAAEVAADFKAATGTDVQISAFPWAVLRQNNTTDLISGTNQYDVMSGGYYLSDVYSYFAPLDDYIAKDNYAQGMIPGLLSPGRSEFVGGKSIGIPYGVDAYGLIFNKDMFEKAGISPDFASWSDVAAACDKIIAANADVACFSHPTGSPEQIGGFFFSGYARTYVSKDGKYSLDVPAATAAAEEIAALWKYLPAKGTALTFDEAHQLFKDQKVAMTITYPSFITNSLDADDSPVKGHWGMAKFPGKGFPWLSLWQLFVPTATEDKDAAWAWIKAYAGPENAKRNLVEHNIGSVWSATYDDPELKAKNAHFWPALIAGFASAKNPPLSGEAQDLLTNTLQDIVNGRVSAADGIAAVESQWAAIPVPAAMLEAAAGSGLQEK